MARAGVVGIEGVDTRRLAAPRDRRDAMRRLDSDLDADSPRTRPLASGDEVPTSRGA
jgi:hypothetical protein